MVVLALAAAGAGCMGTTHASRRAEAPPQAAATPAETGAGAAQGMPEQGMGMMGECPMAVPGTQVAAADTPDGESVTFTTTSPDAVADLRNRVRAMADMHNRHHAGGQMGMQGGAGMQGDTSGGTSMGSSESESGSAGAEASPDQGSAGSGQGSDEAGGGDTGMGSTGSADAGADQGAGAPMHERMMSHPSHAVVEDVDGGARVIVTPDDPADLERLRAAVRSHTERMSETGSCGMGRMGHGMPQEQQPPPQQ